MTRPDWRKRLERAQATLSDDADERLRDEFWRNIHNARADCSVCAKCGAALAPDTPIWRENLSLGHTWLGFWHFWIAPVCEGCKTAWRSFCSPQPCEGCHVLTLRALAVRKKAQPPFDLPPLSGSD